LCELCRQWGNCRDLFLQADTIDKGLKLQNIMVKWKASQDGLVGSFEHEKENVIVTFSPYINFVW